MQIFVLTKIAMGSLIKLCFLISTHIGVILATVFFLTNHGRRISFGTFYFYDIQADLVGFIFLFVSISLIIVILGIISYAPINLSLKILKGIKIKADLSKN